MIESLLFFCSEAGREAWWYMEGDSRMGHTAKCTWVICRGHGHGMDGIRGVLDGQVAVQAEEG